MARWSQIIGILKEHQAGLSVGELCRKHGISDATFDIWRKKLKKLLAPQMMDVAKLREMLGKNF